MKKVNVVVKETLVVMKVVEVEVTPTMDGDEDAIHKKAQEIAYKDGYMSNEDESLGGWTVIDCLEVNCETSDVAFS